MSVLRYSQRNHLPENLHFQLNNQQGHPFTASVAYVFGEARWGDASKLKVEFRGRAILQDGTPGSIGRAISVNLNEVPASVREFLEKDPLLSVFRMVIASLPSKATQ